jgi:replication-associated recombination protein RarA
LGQEHLTGKNGTIRKMIENDTLKSLILGYIRTGKLLWQKLSLKIREGNFLNFLPFLAV